MGRGQRKFNDKEKWCPACEQWLALAVFGSNRATPSGKSSYCLSCTAKKQPEYRTPGYQREWLYGISEEEYQRRLQEQDYRCLICRKKKRLCVDHDHATGEIRGLLCITCNALLGHFEKNPDLLQAVLRYLGIKQVDTEGDTCHDTASCSV